MDHRVDTGVLYNPERPRECFCPMADAYIDFDEAGIYGDYAVDQIAQRIYGRIREFDPALHWLVTVLRMETEGVAAQLRAARAVHDGLHADVASREGPVAESRDAITRFARHLESHRAGSVPFPTFFVEPPVTLAARSPSRLVAALDHIVGTLAEQHANVRESAYWQSELSGARDRLRAALAAARPAHVSPTPALVAARERWLAAYNAAKHVVAAVLTLAGGHPGMDAIFDDLAEVHRTLGVQDDAPGTPIMPLSPAIPPAAAGPAG